LEEKQMIRKCLGVLVAGMLIAAPMKSAEAQGFEEGYMDIGLVIGIGGIGDASLAFGGRFEKALRPIESLGNGIVGIQIGFQYYSWSSFGYSVSYIPIGATANYHFKLTDVKWDPFVGLGLGFEIVTCDIPGPFGCEGYSSGIYFIGRAGIRYFVGPKIAIYADVGAGGATINIGAMLRLK
jgi:hypothetical protein